MPTIVVDDREKKPYQFPGINDVEHRRLNVGDYTHDGFEDVYAVERKSLPDLADSLTFKRRELFEEEIQRAQAMEDFVVVIEADRRAVEEFGRYLDRQKDRHDRTFSDVRQRALNGNLTRHLPYLNGAHPNSMMGSVRSWANKYDNLAFHWAGDRQSAKQETLRLLDKWYLRYSP